jgi:hypothetical protein
MQFIGAKSVKKSMDVERALQVVKPDKQFEMDPYS